MHTTIGSGSLPGCNNKNNQRRVVINKIITNQAHRLSTATTEMAATTYLVLLLTLLCNTTTATGTCTLEGTDTILHCWNLPGFPDGEFPTVTSINLHHNKFPQLTSSLIINCKLYNVEVVHIRHSNIRTIGAGAFATMHRVIHLDLLGNNLTVLEDHAFDGLGSLKHLCLAHNQIGTINPAAFKPLTDLETLDISFNRIRNLTTLPLNNAIMELDLSGNPIEFSEQEILPFTLLLKLVLKSCNLTQLPPNVFNKLQKLRLLDLSNNSIHDLPAYIFDHLFELEQLDISDNPILFLSLASFPVPSKIKYILCDQTPLQLAGKCEEILKSVGISEKKMITNSGKNEGVPVNTEITHNTKNRTNPTRNYQPEKLKVPYILLIALIIILIIFAIGCYLYSRRSEYNNLPIDI